MNGPTLPTDFWIRLDERFDKIHEKLDENKKDIADIKSKGCAHRPDDNRRITSLEEWKEGTTNKFIAGLLGIIASLVTALYSVFKY